MGTIMAAWKDDGKTGALLCWVWADEQQGEGVTVCECVCVCARVHVCVHTQTQSWLSRNTSWKQVLQEGGPLEIPRVGSCLTLRNKLSEETHVLTTQEALLGRGAQAESRRVREPRRTALPHGSQFYGDGVSFRVVSGQSF